jgi:hypothetical protein
MAVLAAAAAGLDLARAALPHQDKVLRGVTAAVVTVPLAAAERAQLVITVQRLAPRVEETVLPHQSQAHL